MPINIEQNKEKKKEKVKEIFLAVGSSFFSLVSRLPLFSFVFLLSQNVRPRAKDSMNTRRTDASVFFLYVHARLSLLASNSNYHNDQHAFLPFKFDQ